MASLLGGMNAELWQTLTMWVDLDKLLRNTFGHSFRQH